MAVGVNSGGTFQVVLRMKDEASEVVQKFAKNTVEVLGETGKNVAAGGASVEKVGSQYKKIGMVAAGATAAVAVFGAATLKSGIDAADKMNELSKRIGISTEKLSVLQYVGGQAGTSIEKIGNSIRQMENNLAKAADDPKDKLNGLLEKYDLFAEGLQKQGPEQALLTVADALDKITDPMDKVRLTQELFGKSGIDMIAVLEGGSKAFKESEADAKAWGLIVDGEAAKAADKFNDQIDRLKKSTGGVATVLANELSKPLAEIAKVFADGVQKTDALKVAGDGLLIVLRAVGAAATVVGYSVAVTGKIIGGVAAAAAAIASGGFSDAARIMGELKGDIEETTKKTDELLRQIIGLKGDASANSGTPAAKSKAKENARGKTGPVAFFGDDGGGFMNAAFGSAGGPQVFSDFESEGDVIAEQLVEAMDKRTKTAMNAARSMVHLGLHNIEEMLKTDEARINDAYAQRQATLDNAEALGLQTESSYAEMRIELEQRKQGELEKLHREAAARKYGVTLVYDRMSLAASQFFFSQMGALMQTNSRKLFEIGKAGAIAETIIQTYRAAMGAYAAMASIPFVGPALGAAAAAAAIAVGFARVQAINSTQYGTASGSPVLSSGGATGPVVAGGSAVVPFESTQPRVSAAPAQTVNLYLSGEGSPTQSYIRDVLVPGLREALGDGVTLNLRTGNGFVRGGG